jgi:hypothetical protein
VALALAFAGGLAGALLPVAFRNWWVGGEFHLTTSQLGPNLYIGNHPGAPGGYEPLRPGRGSAEFERQDATELAEQALGRRLARRSRLLDTAPSHTRPPSPPTGCA